MPRIATDQPSSGRPIALAVPIAVNDGFVDTQWTTLAEAPDFTIPGTGDSGEIPDPANANRQLRGGEIFIESPLIATNTTATARWIDVMIAMEGMGGAFDGGIFLPAVNKIFCIPAFSSEGRLYNLTTGLIEHTNGLWPGNRSTFAGGVRLLDGRVFTINLSANSARIYNPGPGTISGQAPDTVITPAGSYPEGFESGVVLLSDGRVLLTPRDSTFALIYDPTANTLTQTASIFPGGSNFIGATRLSDGRVFLNPFNSTTARIYNPGPGTISGQAANTVITPGGTFPAVAGAYSTSTLLSDGTGRVLCIPLTGPATAVVFNPAGGGSVSAVLGSAGAGYLGGVNLLDGSNRVFLVPHIRDPGTGADVTPFIGPGLMRVGGCGHAAAPC